MIKLIICLQAAAVTAGLAAYFIRLSQLGELRTEDGTAVDGTPLGIKRHIVSTAWARHSSDRAPDKIRRGIFNGVNAEQQSCTWSAENQALQARRLDGPQCGVQSSSITMSSPPSVVSPTFKETTLSTTQMRPNPQTTFSPTMEPQNPVCHSEADFKGHADIRKSAVVGRAGDACSRWSGSPYGMCE